MDDKDTLLGVALCMERLEAVAPPFFDPFVRMCIAFSFALGRSRAAAELQFSIFTSRLCQEFRGKPGHELLLFTSRTQDV